MAVPAAIVPAPTERLPFLDAVRGFALLLMILNHTGHWWQDGTMGWPRYNLIYTTLAVGAPLFLFLVGFCLPLSFARRRGMGAPVDLAVVGKFLQRGARLVLASWLLNFLVFRDEPFWEGGVLQTIGLGIIFCVPPMLLLHRRGAPFLLVAVAVLLYGLFAVSYERIAQWIVVHPVAGRIWFFEFAPWPWIGLVWIGLALGWVWVGQDTPERRRRYVATMAGAGVLGLAAYVLWNRAHDVSFHRSLAFTRDFILNDHWTPRGITTLLCLGAVFSLLGLSYYLVEVRRLPVGWLVVLGRTSLVIYFVHHLIVLTFAHEWLGLSFNPWWQYGLANAALVIALYALGRVWLELKHVAGRRLQPA